MHRFPQDVVGSTDSIIVLEQPIESPFSEDTTEFFSFDMIESLGDFYKITCDNGEAVRVKKSNVRSIET